MIELSNENGRLCGASVRGAAHHRVGKINQDACLGDVFGEWSFIAVADGHGSEPHFRSDRGSRFAVVAARDVICDWIATADFRNGSAPVTGLPQLISDRWRAYVDADLFREPTPVVNSDRRLLPYGSTLAAAALNKTHAFFVQIGDGDILLDDGGGILMRPLAADVGLIGEQTYSLCLPDPMPHFRVAVHTLKPTTGSRPFAIACTDGLSKSYLTETNFVKAIQNWKDIVAVHGIKPAVDSLAQWIARVSEQGNGDDISLMLYAAS